MMPVAPAISLGYLQSYAHICLLAALHPRLETSYRHLRPYMIEEALLDQEKCLSWRISVPNEFAVHHTVNINWPNNS
jgi:hypothetical protein